MSDNNTEELQRQASENTLALNPAIGLRGKDILAAARVLVGQGLKQPLHSAKHLARFGKTLGSVLLGQSPLQPEASDKRFADPTWLQNPLYKRYLQTYLAWRQEMHAWVQNSNLSEDDQPWALCHQPLHRGHVTQQQHG